MVYASWICCDLNIIIYVSDIPVLSISLISWEKVRWERSRSLKPSFKIPFYYCMLVCVSIWPREDFWWDLEIEPSLSGKNFYSSPHLVDPTKQVLILALLIDWTRKEQTVCSLNIIHQMETEHCLLDQFPQSVFWLCIWSNSNLRNIPTGQNYGKEGKKLSSILFLSIPGNSCYYWGLF